MEVGAILTTCQQRLRAFAHSRYEQVLAVRVLPRKHNGHLWASPTPTRWKKARQGSVSSVAWEGWLGGVGRGAVSGRGAVDVTTEAVWGGKLFLLWLHLDCLPTSAHNVITASQLVVGMAVLTQSGPGRLSPVLIAFGFDGSCQKLAMTLFPGFVSSGTGTASAHGWPVPPRQLTSHGEYKWRFFSGTGAGTSALPHPSGNLCCSWLFPYLGFIAVQNSWV